MIAPIVQPHTRKCNITKGWTAWLKGGGSVSSALSGAVVVLSLNITMTSAEPPIPFVTTSSSVAVTTIPTPTLPARLTLLAPAFGLPAGAGDLTITYDWLPADVSSLLAYRPDGASPWQKIPVRMNEAARQIVVLDAPAGEYALVQVSIQTALPGNAIVVDDLSAGFARYGPPGNWHDATYPASAYYLGHAYWTSNTYNTAENWGVWTPPALDGPHEVLVFVPSNYADTTHAVYWVQHAGQGDWRPVNQSIYWAEWVSLSVFTFTAGSESYVYLSDVTYEPYGTRWVAFDAVAFVPMRTYLPLVMHNYPPPMKQWTGIHLGNHEEKDNGDWTAEMLQPIDGDNGRSWPCVIVVQSKQIWNAWRPTESPCEVAGAGVREDRANVYDYLTRAANNGVTIIIRIAPSPGNFEDWDGTGSHTLITTTTPAGGDYCGGKWEYFRAIDDLVKEMDAIHTRNEINGWPDNCCYFEPANEPNLEWYPDGTTPPINSAEAWQAMDDYFAALVAYARQHYPGLQILTPPMAQGRYAEGIDWRGDYPTNFCPRQLVEGKWKGYDLMLDTYFWRVDGYHGYSWHNYYTQGRESYSMCDYGGFHVSYHFPDFMTYEIIFNDRSAFVTEADLCSWFDDKTGQCYNTNPIHDKEDDPAATSLSLWYFFSSEHSMGGADAITLWLLNNDEADREEYDWHEAYAETTHSHYDWFDQWWQETQ